MACKVVDFQLDHIQVQRKTQGHVVDIQAQKLVVLLEISDIQEQALA